MIHKTAIVDPAAKLGNNVLVGAYTIIEANVEIGDDCQIGPHVVIKSHTKMGNKNKIYQFSSIGEDPQDLKYKGEETYLEIGTGNIIREYCTLNRGTHEGGGVTKIGNNNLLMAYVHIAHDCVLGNHIILANNASLAGHVQIDDYVGLGGLSGVHQYCRIGTHSFAAGGSMINKDVLPYLMVSGYYAKPFGLNTIGLKRRGFSDERISDIKAIYKIVYRKGLSVQDSIAEIKEQFLDSEDAKLFLEMLEDTDRGFVR
ncbi:MAG: acyl-[acyl-carrier-protein]--UDP-N-acetylglucosamine O-acyltransferase [Gammaproteobacteria bacterium RIFCSPHIGHO2_12_FULL_35_23]|nr:MAG: acyl-[acyl-carrier-protein]--UDP-N-acetylglucosamine O-acyltransferase [Gammaproteobacteria bacterium RIFCSPHIGHO2_12_FULL_35_23]